MLTSLFTSESNEEDAGDFSHVSRDDLRCHASPHSPWPPAPASITDGNLEVTCPFFGSAWLGVSAGKTKGLLQLAAALGCWVPGQQVRGSARQAGVCGRLGGPSCESGVSCCRASLDPDQAFQTGLWTPWGPAGLSRPGPRLWLLCV